MNHLSSPWPGGALFIFRIYSGSILTEFRRDVFETLTSRFGSRVDISCPNKGA